MPFNPLLPAHGSEITSAELRNQFNGLKDLIDAVPVPGIAYVLAVAGDAENQSLINLNHCYAADLATNELVARDGDSINLLNTKLANARVLYTPANPGHWAGTPPVSLAEAIDRLAAALSNNGANPIN